MSFFSRLFSDDETENVAIKSLRRLLYSLEERVAKLEQGHKKPPPINHIWISTSGEPFKWVSPRDVDVRVDTLMEHLGLEEKHIESHTIITKKEKTK